MSEVKSHWKKWLYWFFLGIVLIAVYKTFDNFGSIAEGIKKFMRVLTPFFAGALISYILYMPCKKVESACRKSKVRIIRKKSRGLSVFLVYIISALIILILINVILPVLFESVTDFISNIQVHLETAIVKYNEIPEDSFLKGDIANELVQNVQNIDIKQYFQLETILSYAASAVGMLTGVFDVFVAVIVSIYILMERTQILKFVKKCAAAMLKEQTYSNLDRYFNNSNEIFFKFITSQFIDAIIVGILVTIILSIMKVKYAILLGFFIGLFNMIPYFGAIIAVAISALITLITGGLVEAIWMLISVIILQQIDANIINPKIIGQSLKISPILVILAVAIGGAYFGVLGMFLAVPVVAVLKIVVEDYIDFKLENKYNNRLQ